MGQFEQLEAVAKRARAAAASPGLGPKGRVAKHDIERGSLLSVRALEKLRQFSNAKRPDRVDLLAEYDWVASNLPKKPDTWEPGDVPSKAALALMLTALREPRQFMADYRKFREKREHEDPEQSAVEDSLEEERVRLIKTIDVVLEASVGALRVVRDREYATFRERGRRTPLQEVQKAVSTQK
jgi:hypothetical protein